MNLYNIRKFIHNFGLDVRKYPTPLLRNRLKLWNKYDVQLILDVGANVGQYGSQIRSIGYKHKIISFEPYLNAFTSLTKKTNKDGKWEALNIALGDFDRQETLHISKNSASSSLKKINDVHLKAEPNTLTIGTEEVVVRKLDSIYSDLNPNDENVFLKIDAQGFEKNILQGAEKSLPNIKGLQLELSIVELYEGEALFQEMLDFCTERGFTLHSIEPNFWDFKTGRLYQFDGIFYRAA